ncbi:MAG: hypothetical protein ACI4JK_06195 [Oscillospiraceae bacterium]
MIKKRSKTIAMLTTAAMTVSLLPAVPSFSAEENEKTVDVTLSDWSYTLDYSDTDVELTETTVTLTPDMSSTLDFKGIYTEYDPAADPVTKSFDDEGESGGYQFNSWDSKSDIVSAINQQEGLELTDYSVVEITGFSIDYSWKYSSSEEERIPNIIVWPCVWGEDADGNDANNSGDLVTYHSTMTGSGTFSTAECRDSVQPVDIIRGFSLNAGASTNNPDDVLEFSWDSITLTVGYSETSRGGWKSTYDGGNTWDFFKHYDNGTSSDMFIEILDAIKEQTGSRPESSSIQINDISADFSWDFKTEQENPDISIMSGTGGTNGDEKYDLNIPDDKTDYQFTGKSGSGSISASKVTALSDVEITDYEYMNIAIGAWTDNPEDTLTFSLTNITFNVTYQAVSGDNGDCSYLTYEELQDAKYISVSFNKNKIGDCGHDDHIGEDGVNYFEGWTYCPWAEIFVTRVSADGTRSETYTASPGPADHESDTYLITYSDIIATTGELSEGDTLEFTCYDSAVITKLEASSTLPDIILNTGSIDELFIEESSDWVDGESVPNGKPEIMPTITIASFAAETSFNGYEAIKIDYTLKNPGKCSGIVVILHGWEENSVGWDMRYYEATGGSIIIDLSDMQDKTFHNIYVGPVALSTSQIGDSFTPCFEVTSAAILTSCSEDATAQIDPIEPIDPPEYDELGRKTVNVTIDSDWTGTVDFSDVDTENGEFRHLYNDDTQSGSWYIDKYVNDNLNSEILSALKEQTGDTPCEWPFVINDITAVCEWELTTDGTDSGATGEVQFLPNTCGMTGEDVWRDSYNSDDPSYKFSEKTGSCNISASRIAALSDVTDISDYYGMSLDIGTWSNDPSAKLILRITSVKLNITYVPTKAIYLSYEELKDAKYVVINADVTKIGECGHEADHIGDDGVKYYEGWTYCPWPCAEIRRIDADGNVSDSYYANLDAKNEPTTSTLKSLSDITAITGEISEGDVLEFSSTDSATITNVEALDTLPDVELDPVTIDEVTIQEECDWDAELGSVPNGRIEIVYTEMVAGSSEPYKANDYAAIKFNYTLKNPDECSAIVVILNGWNEDGTGWLMKYYPVSGESGTIVVDLSTLKDKTFQQIYVGVVAQPTVKIGDSFNPGFAANGTLMASCTDEFTEEIEPVLSVFNSIDLVNEICEKNKDSDETYILTEDELKAIEAVLAYDYKK